MIKWFRKGKKREESEVVEDVEMGEEIGEEIAEEEDSLEASPETEEAEVGEEKEESVEPPEDSDEDTEEILSLEEEAEEAESQVEAGEEDESRGFLGGLRKRLSKTRERLVGRLDRLILGKKQIDDDLLDELEEILITADLGVRTTQELISSVTEKVRRKELSQPDKLKEYLREEIKNYFKDLPVDIDYSKAKPFVTLFIGVNGVGKTTSIAKLAYKLKNEGKQVMLVAADTFRAAAIEQLVHWGEKAGVEVVRQKSGADPSAVVFDALTAAMARDVDVVLIDTAGRMHTKVNLMEELKKIKRVIGKKIPDAPHEILLVLDATTGQNAMSQAKLFSEQLGISGLVLTKLDGTAKGGIVVGICRELKVPVKYIGVGEKISDLQPFEPYAFVDAIF